jgi:hypothetical protein
MDFGMREAADDERAERLKLARFGRDYASAADAARALGVSPSTYHENAIRGFRRSVERYAAFFRVSLEWLLTGRGPMRTEPESLILELLRQMRAEMASKADLEALRTDLRAELANKGELRSEMHSLRADVASDILSTRKDLSEQIVGLRRTVIEYHTSVIGHGVLISELGARMRRVEQHLNLPSLYPT